MSLRNLKARAIHSKLGKCRRCMTLTAVLLSASVAALALTVGNAVASSVASAGVGFSSVFALAHGVAFAYRRRPGPQSAPTSGCGCGG